MSIITSVFHIYGFLITEEAANLILRYTEKVFPDLYKEFSDPEPLLAFQEYLCEKLDGCRYGTAESMTVWRIKDREELDLNPGEEFYIIELKNSSHLFSQTYSSYTEVIQEIQETFGELLPRIVGRYTDTHICRQYEYASTGGSPIHLPAVRELCNKIHDQNHDGYVICSNRFYQMQYWSHGKEQAWAYLLL